MCDIENSDTRKKIGVKTIPVDEAIGTVLAHDITEIRKEDFKGRAFKKGHIIRKEDIGHLQRLGKEHLFVMSIAGDEMHENDAARAVAEALMGEGVKIKGEPREGKITIIADRSGLLKVDKEALFQFNMLGEVMCATLHDNMVVKEGQTVAGTRAIPLVVNRNIVKDAVAIAEGAGKVISLKELRRPKAGIVITGNEVYYGRIKDAFAPIITKKLHAYGGEVVGTYYAPDDETFIEERLKELIDAGADLLVTTGGMSVDPDDVTRFAIRRLGAGEISYGSPVLPGAMFLVAYIENGNKQHEAGNEVQKGGNGSSDNEKHSSAIPVLGIPACGMYSNITVFDMILPRVLAGERIGRRQLAELGHGGLCLKCDTCRYPVCPFGKQ
jgi:molybdenum cofactor synthesis domain-containing protein